MAEGVNDAVQAAIDAARQAGLQKEPGETPEPTPDEKAVPDRITKIEKDLYIIKQGLGMVLTAVVGGKVMANPEVLKELGMATEEAPKVKIAPAGSVPGT